MGDVIAVVSGKGGTGKTTVCAGVASALAMAGESVLCIDCDVGLRNLDIALGISDLQALSFVGYTAVSILWMRRPGTRIIPLWLF